MNAAHIGFLLLLSICAGGSAALPRRHLNAASELAPAPSAEVALPANLVSADALLTIVNPNGSGAVSLPVSAGTTVRASMTQFTVVSPQGAVQAAVAIVPGMGSVNVQPSAGAHGAITLVDTAGNSFQVSLERPVAPAPGLPADISADLASQPRYVDVSTSFGITGPTDSFSNMFSYGSSTGVSYSEDITTPVFTRSESISVSSGGK